METEITKIIEPAYDEVQVYHGFDEDYYSHDFSGLLEENYG